jgi:methylmalonyl-CoA mutase N-terminal domain/subunit
VNKYETEEDQTFVPFAINPDSEREQVSAVESVRQSRDSDRVERALAQLGEDARANRNVMPATIEAVKAYATVGEIVAVLAGVFGSWKPSANF